MPGYEAEFRSSIDDPEAFWATRAPAVAWDETWRQVLDPEAKPGSRWFVGARLNTCFNCVDRHVLAGHGDRTALFHESPGAGVSAAITYAELLDRVARVAGGLQSLGVAKGDHVLIYMPMIPEIVIAMLACARLGAVHSLVGGGCPSEELALRIDGFRPKVVLWGACGVEPSRVVEYQPLLERALQLAQWQVESTVVRQRVQARAPLKDGRDHCWIQLERSSSPVSCTSVEATDPLYIMYTAGTTGKPKGVIRDNGGHAVALTWSMRAVYDIGPGDVFWAASDAGWQPSHSYGAYAPLLAGASTVVFEGQPIGTPDAGVYWEVIERLGIKAILVPPSAVQAIRSQDPEGFLAEGRDLSSLEAVFVAGEWVDAETHVWTRNLLGVPVVDQYWQTETGWPVCCICRGIEELPTRSGSVNRCVPGYDVVALDAQGQPLEPGLEGALALRLPLPPGALATLWRDDGGFVRAYLDPYPGFYFTGDCGWIDVDGYVFVAGRLNDVTA